jgi:hypothetical protein
MKNKPAWRFGAKGLKGLREAFGDRDPSAQPIVLQEWSADLDVDFDFAKARSEGSFFNESGEGGWQFRSYEVDSQLRDFENVPLKEDIHCYFTREVLPHVADAWMDRSKDKIGYEINFNRHFYHFTEPRELKEIDAEIELAEKEFMRLFKEVTAV